MKTPPIDDEVNNLVNSALVKAQTQAKGFAVTASKTFQPGDVFGFVIHKITGQLTANCGKCGARKIQMNAWGWIGCLKPVNFKAIKGWIVEEAKARGHEITERQVAGLLKTAFKELRKKK